MPSSQGKTYSQQTTANSTTQAATAILKGQRRDRRTRRPWLRPSSWRSRRPSIDLARPSTSRTCGLGGSRSQLPGTGGLAPCSSTDQSQPTPPVSSSPARRSGAQRGEPESADASWRPGSRVGVRSRPSGGGVADGPTSAGAEPGGAKEAAAPKGAAPSGTGGGGSGSPHPGVPNEAGVPWPEAGPVGCAVPYPPGVAPGAWPPGPNAVGEP